jgi:hypothetical protein
MENKKLLNFLLKDLNEIDELFSEKNTSEFDQLELEFIQTRLRGAIKLVQIFSDRETSDSGQEMKIENQHVHETIQEKVMEKEIIVESQNISEKTVVKKEPESVQEEKPEIAKQAAETLKEAIEELNDVELEEEINESADKRLGDVFAKEKSINDLLADTNKLEKVLSNRPVKSIQSAIGINDRFQYIRELFEGKADDFVKTVDELDGMESLADAVQFLQVNYKWKKNETSLKFVNLIKRRFLNE